MTAKTTHERIKETFKLYESGLSFNEISKILKIHPSTLQRLYRENGGVARKTSQGRKPARTINHLPEQSICDEYISGMSENAISKKYGVSRNVISRLLLLHGVNRRSQSEAESIKWSKMSKEQRLNQVKNCHRAVKGAAKTDETKHKIAVSRQRDTPDWYIGVGEKEFRNLLSLNSIDFEYQKPVLGYNLDFFINGVAVELTSFTGRNSRVKKPQQVRAFNIFNSDSIHTLAVEIETKNDIGLFYNQIMSAVFDLQKQDKSYCNYWIARCSGNSFSLEKIVIKTLQ